MANISKADLIKELAEQNNIGQKDVKTVVDGMLSSMILVAKSGSAAN